MTVDGSTAVYKVTVREIQKVTEKKRLKQITLLHIHTICMQIVDQLFLFYSWKRQSTLRPSSFRICKACENHWRFNCRSLSLIVTISHNILALSLLKILYCANLQRKRTRMYQERFWITKHQHRNKLTN